MKDLAHVLRYQPCMGHVLKKKSRRDRDHSLLKRQIRCNKHVGAYATRRKSSPSPSAHHKKISQCLNPRTDHPSTNSLVHVNPNTPEKSGARPTSCRGPPAPSGSSRQTHCKRSANIRLSPDCTPPSYSSRTPESASGARSSVPVSSHSCSPRSASWARTPTVNNPACRSGALW